MKKCYRITIGGYQAEVDHRGMIITCDPKIKSLLFQNINDVFNKYKHRTAFKKVTTIHYPMIVSNDIIKQMISKNPAVELLRQKFDCEIF